MTKLKVGDKAPDFNLPSNTGENVALSQFLGKKWVVVYFYPMDESPVCSKEAETFRNKYGAFKELDTEVVGISSQSVESHVSFASRHELPFVLLSDSGNKVRKLYGVSSTLGVLPGRETYVVDKKGVVRFVFSSQLQPSRHAHEALSFIKKDRQKN